MSSQSLERARTGCRLVSIFFLAVVLIGCQRRPGSDEPAQPAGDRSATENERSTPPYPTKEPSRYQARMITTGSLDPQPVAGGRSDISSVETLIIRDGERRRTEYDLRPGLRLVSLQRPDGDYLLWPSKQLYADADEDPGDDPPLTGDSASDFSPDRLLNESQVGASYAKLGSEVIDGRSTTKYRVTSRGRLGAAKNVTTETIIWIDESLGMPIKSDTTSTGEEAGHGRYIMEMRDIKLDVDPSLLELPPGYRKVTLKEFFALLYPRTSGRPAG